MKDNDTMQGYDRICAVVVTYNRKALLDECLTALLSQTRRLDEIIVVDNASTDGTTDLMKAQFPELTYVRLAKNSGGAGGFHYGMKLAFEKGHDWIWVMDDDAIAMADALERLTHPQLIAPGQVAALATAVIDTNGSVYENHRRLLDGLRLTKWVFELNNHCAPLEMYSEPYFEIDTGSFVGLLVSREAIQKVGLPIKEFFIYWDDVEYSLRLRRIGRILTVPDSTIVHKPPTPTPTLIWQKTYCFHRNRVYTCRLHDRPGISFYWRALVTAIPVFQQLTVNFVLSHLIRLKKRVTLRSKAK